MLIFSFFGAICFFGGVFAGFCCFSFFPLLPFLLLLRFPFLRASPGYHSVPGVSSEVFWGAGPTLEAFVALRCGIAVQHASCKVGWPRNLQIFDPLEPSKSSIFIERVIIFEGFDVLSSKAYFGLSWHPFWHFLRPSWDVLGTSWRHVGGSWGFKTGESDIRPHPFARDMRQNACQIHPGKRAPRGAPRGPQETPKSFK